MNDSLPTQGQEPDACPKCGHPMADHYADEGGCIHSGCACEKADQ